MALIRAAEMRDAAAIAHVHVQSWITTYKGIVPQVYLAALDEVERVPLRQDWLKCDISIFVAEVDGQIVGFSAGGAIREPLQEYESELYTLYLLKQVQGLGIGKALFRAVTGTLLQRATKVCSCGCSNRTQRFTFTKVEWSVRDEQAD